MKLLRITAEGLPLFKEKLDVSFYAQQRVAKEDKTNLYSLFSNVYLNPSITFIGINASGKTSVLKVIHLALGIINNEPINHLYAKDILGNTEKTVLNVYFYSDIRKEICRLETVITSYDTKVSGTVYRIESESLWAKKIEKVTTRKSMLDFDGQKAIIVRDKTESFLSDDVSIMIAYNKNTGEHIKVVSMLLFTNMNVLPFSEGIPSEIISYLDPTIEKLKFEEINDKPTIYLQFKGKEAVVLNNAIELNNYLSSGTVKGIVTFTLAQEVLREGGYLIVDEVENHFNKEIVSTLIRFFMDGTINKNGGVLIFSTHYPELLDEYDRNDSIFITRNRDGITAEKLSDILKRNDINKSDAYQSGYLGGTAPDYEAYMQLKKRIVASL